MTDKIMLGGSMQPDAETIGGEVWGQLMAALTMGLYASEAGR